LGATYITLRLRSFGGEGGSVELKLLVDTGSTYSWIPKKVLEGLGVKPKGKWYFGTMTGERASREVGDVMVEWGELAGPTTVVFAQEGEGSVFGLHGLESLGLEVDPVTKEVRRSESLLALSEGRGKDRVIDLDAILKENKELKAFIDSMMKEYRELVKQNVLELMKNGTPLQIMDCAMNLVKEVYEGKQKVEDKLIMVFIANSMVSVSIMKILMNQSL